jgi:CRP-like cAMP-binding protein
MKLATDPKLYFRTLKDGTFEKRLNWSVDTSTEVAVRTFHIEQGRGSTSEGSQDPFHKTSLLGINGSFSVDVRDSSHNLYREDSRDGKVITYSLFLDHEPPTPDRVTYARVRPLVNTLEEFVKYRDIFSGKVECGADNFDPKSDSDKYAGAWSVPTAKWNMTSDCLDGDGTINDRGQFLHGYFLDDKTAAPGADPYSWVCRPCPPGGNCSGHITNHGIRTLDGWWKIPDEDSNTDLVATLSRPNRMLSEEDSANKKRNNGNQPLQMFSRCLNEESCSHKTSKVLSAGSEAEAEELPCASGYNEDSRLCAICSHNYRRDNSEFTCEKCPEKSLGSFLLFLACVCIVAILAALVWVQILTVVRVARSASMIDEESDQKDGSFKAKGKLAFDRQIATLQDGLLKIGINYLQCIMFIAWFDIPWPKLIGKGMFKVIEGIGTGGFSLVDLDCAMQHHFAVESRLIENATIASNATAKSAGDVRAVETMTFRSRSELLAIESGIMLALPLVLTAFSCALWMVIISTPLKHSCQGGRSKKETSSKSDTNKPLLPTKVLPARTENSTGIADEAGDCDSSTVTDWLPAQKHNAPTSHDNTFSVLRLGVRWKSRTAASRKKLVAWRDCIFVSAVTIIFMLYPNMVRHAMHFLECREVRTTKFYFKLHMEVPCFATEHLHLALTLGVPGLLIYAVGMPVCALVLVLRTNKKKQKRKLSEGQQSHSFVRLVLLMVSYRQKRRWWESICTSRKVIMIAIAIFLGSRRGGPELQISVAILVCFAYMSALYAFDPFSGDRRPSYASHVSAGISKSMVDTTKISPKKPPTLRASPSPTKQVIEEESVRDMLASILHGAELGGLFCELVTYLAALAYLDEAEGRTEHLKDLFVQDWFVHASTWGLIALNVLYIVALMLLACRGHRLIREANKKQQKEDQARLDALFGGASQTMQLVSAPPAAVSVQVPIAAAKEDSADNEQDHSDVRDCVKDESRSVAMGEVQGRGGGRITAAPADGDSGEKTDTVFFPTQDLTEILDEHDDDHDVVAEHNDHHATLHCKVGEGVAEITSSEVAIKASIESADMADTIRTARTVHADHEKAEHALQKKIARRQRRQSVRLEARLAARQTLITSTVLNDAPVFAPLNLSDAARRKVAEAMTLGIFKKGQVVCKQGAAADAFYVVMRGACEERQRTILDLGTKEGELTHGKTVARVERLDYFGAAALCDCIEEDFAGVEEKEQDSAKRRPKSPPLRTTSVIAVTSPCHVLMLKRATFKRLSQQTDIFDRSKLLDLVSKAAAERQTRQNRGFAARLWSQRKHRRASASATLSSSGTATLSVLLGVALTFGAMLSCADAACVDYTFENCSGHRECKWSGIECGPWCENGYHYNNASDGADADAHSNCVMCPLGRFSGLPETRESTSCQECEKGRYGLRKGLSQCAFCPAGRYNDETGQNSSTTGCQECDAGKYSSQEGSEREADCRKCDRGKSSSFVGRTSANECISCIAGKFAETQGSVECTFCDFGKFTDEIGSEECKKCPRGFVSNATGEGQNCTVCPWGKYEDEGMCVMCELGKFQDQTGKTKCDACEVGKYADSVGNHKCTNCEAGKRNSAQNTMECQDCEEGTFGDVCTPCPTGRFKNTSGIGSCTKCPKGRFQNAEGSSSCISCDPGKHQAVEGQLACTDCKAERFADDEQHATCKDCPMGKTTNNMSGSTICSNCALGESTQGKAGSPCVLCPAGFVSSPNRSVCEACPAGWAQADPGKSQCEICDGEKGEIAKADGTGCELCGRGMKANASRCEPCEGGTSRAEASAKNTCKICKIGSASRLSDDATSDLATSIVDQSTGCTRCNKGTFEYYQDKEGQDVCERCPHGWVSIETECKIDVDVFLDPPFRNATTRIAIRRLERGGAQIYFKGLGMSSGEDLVVEISMSDAEDSSTQSEKKCDRDRSDVHPDACFLTARDLSVAPPNKRTENCIRNALSTPDHSVCITDVTSTTVNLSFPFLDLARNVLFARVKAVKGSEMVLHRWSGWSEKWMNAWDCDCENKFLNTHDQPLHPEHWTCQECMVGGSCAGPVTWDEVYAKAGFYRTRNAPLGAGTGLFVGPEKGCTVDSCLGVAKDIRELKIEDCKEVRKARQTQRSLIVPDTTASWETPQCNNISSTTGTVCLQSRAGVERCNEEMGYLDDCSGDAAGERQQCRVCARCMPGYVSGLGGKCEKCLTDEPGQPPWGTLSALGALLASTLVIAVLIALEVSEHASEGEAEKQAEASDALKKIVINYLQVISLAVAFQMNWGPEVKTLLDIQHTAASVGVDALSFSCQMSRSVALNKNFHTFLKVRNGIVLVVPPILLFFVGLVWQGVTRCNCYLSRKLAKHRNDYVIMSSVLILFLLYPSMVRNATSLLSCRPVDKAETAGGGDTLIYVMASDAETECWTLDHAVLIMMFSIPGLIIYCLGLPVAAIVVLTRRKRAGTLHTRQGDLRYSLLYAGYKNSRYWYECVMAMRKFMFVILSVFARQWTARMQAAAVFATISMSALVQLHVKPYINDNPEQKRLHGLEVLNLFVCLATFVGGTCITYFTATRSDGSLDLEMKADADQTMDDIFTSAIVVKCGIIAVNVVFMIVIVQQLVVSIRLENKRKILRRRSTLRAAISARTMQALNTELDEDGVNEDTKNTKYGNDDDGGDASATTTTTNNNNNNSSSNNNNNTTDNKRGRNRAISFASRAQKLSIISWEDTDTLELDAEAEAAHAAITEHHEFHERELKQRVEGQQIAHRARIQKRLKARRKIKAAGCLSRVPMFSSFEPHQMDSIVDSMEFAEFEEGDILVHQGAPAKTFYIIVDGECDVMIKSLTQVFRSIRVAGLGEMQHFGESALLTTKSGSSGLRTASVVATTSGSVLMLSRDHFTSLAVKGVFGPQFAVEIEKQFRERMQFNQAASVWRNSHVAKALKEKMNEEPEC